MSEAEGLVFSTRLSDCELSFEQLNEINNVMLKAIVERVMQEDEQTPAQFGQFDNFPSGGPD